MQPQATDHTRHRYIVVVSTRARAANAPSGRVRTGQAEDRALRLDSIITTSICEALTSIYTKINIDVCGITVHGLTPEARLSARQGESGTLEP